MILFLSGFCHCLNFSSVKHVISLSKIKQASFSGHHQIMTMEEVMFFESLFKAKGCFFCIETPNRSSTFNRCDFFISSNRTLTAATTLNM